ncbi:hypothetical protein LTR05_000505 [Lithohypha guttulata]|uniref:Uncharacterized protein n=1 Tax=Lithohypha guttulata TaxID=1690604 RepID=A0AAN7YJG1_9EURO|nr:hypothetical protein LTR05_000505 [Lithohypha guttulata]
MRLSSLPAANEECSVYDTLSAAMSNSTPGQRMSRNDVHFPLTTPRKRNPSIPLTHAVTEDGQGSGVARLLTSSAYSLTLQDNLNSQKHKATDPTMNGAEEERANPTQSTRHTNFPDLPEEIQNRILDYIFGDLRPVNAASTSTSLSHRMRHPRRKAVSELALVSPDMRIMVQERIYRHIKIKGTKVGLRDSQTWFQSHPHLAGYVRHIEYWVPVWGDKANVISVEQQRQQQQQQLQQQIGYGLLEGTNEHGDFPGLQFKLSNSSATLDQIFDHLGNLFPSTSIFTLEGGHCKNSNMIKHFKNNLFGQYMNQQLRVLPNIKVFAMRGAWNVMRSFEDWNTINEALPCMTEWHCGYAKPRAEAYTTINEILLRLPSGLRHVDISLDSMFSKDDTVLGSSPEKRGHHVCEQLGHIAPRLESLSYTGKVCECFWTAALEASEHDKSRSHSLKSLDIVVKSCCRQRIKSQDIVTGDILVEEIGGIMADGAGISNLVFINAFERLVMGAIDGLAAFHALQHVKLRYIDLDSPCQQLNPYWHLEDGIVTGIWNDKIVEKLNDSCPELRYDRLEDGIETEHTGSTKKNEMYDDVWPRESAGHAGHLPNTTGPSALYPKIIPKSINTASYKIISDARTG